MAMHESQRICGRTPSETFASDVAFGGGIQPIRSRPEARREFVGGIPMETSAYPGRERCAVGPGASRAHTQALPQTVSAADRALEARPAQTRLVHRAVDPAADCRARGSQVRRPVRSIGCMAAVASARLELPEADAACTRTRSGSNRWLAEERLVPHKKTLVAAADRLFFSMNPASCSSRWSVVPGHRAVKRPCLTAGTDMTGCRSSRRLRSRPNAGAWDSTSTFSITTSLRKTWSNSWPNWSVDSGKSRSSWIAGRYIAPLCECSRPVSAGGFTSSGCRLTHLNSTPPNTCGATRSRLTWPTSSQMTSFTWDRALPVRSAIHAEIKPCCVRSSITHNSPSDDLSSLVKDQ